MRTVFADDAGWSFAPPRKRPVLTRFCIQSPYSFIILFFCASGKLFQAVSSKQHINIYCIEISPFYNSAVAERHKAASAQTPDDLAYRVPKLPDMGSRFKRNPNLHSAHAGFGI